MGMQKWPKFYIAGNKCAAQSMHLSAEGVSMRLMRPVVIFAAICLVFAIPGRAQTTPSSLEQLMKDVVYNELQDRERDSHWSYQIQQQIGSQSFVKHQVETEQGPIFRILEQDGKPLTAQAEQKEEERLSALLNSPSALSKNREDHQQDEERLQRMIKLMPEAFLFEAKDPPDGDLLTMSFSPRPDFKPPTYEARVYHAMAGTIVVNQRLKRFVAMQGHLISRVDFGYGLLGYVEKGGKFQIHREQVSASRWKTDLVDVHVAGRVILLKSVSKDHHEARSQFEPVPTTISLDEAKRLLEQAASQSEASLRPAAKF
jgi:hypothetical protein